ncbi:hypothetical protein ACR30T_01400 [Neisseria gonorrhoeae]
MEGVAANPNPAALKGGVSAIKEILIKGLPEPVRRSDGIGGMPSEHQSLS